MADPREAALVGKAGEALVAAELLRRHIDVAYPAYDSGIDLLAYHAGAPDIVIPIQVKARTATCYEFQKGWFRVKGLILVQVWHVVAKPEFYIFGNLADVEDALGPLHTATASWCQRGGYNVTDPNDGHRERMRPHRDQWDRIIKRLAGVPAANGGGSTVLLSQP